MDDARMMGAMLVLFFSGVAGALAPHPTNGQPSNPQASQQPSGTDSVPLLSQRADSLIEQACQQGPETPAQADLCQQWRMAVATERQVRWTIAEVAGLLLVVCLTLVAIRQTRIALGRDRAWLTVTDVSGLVNAIQDKTDGLLVTFRWNNEGGTPAKRAKFYTTWKPYGKGEEPVFMPEWEMPWGGAAIGARGHAGTVAIKIPVENIKAVVRGDCGIKVYSAVDYDDVFSTTRRRSERTESLVVTLAEDGFVDDPEMLRGNIYFITSGPQQSAT